MRMRFMSIAVALLSACTTPLPGGSGAAGASSDTVRDCLIFLEELDHVVNVAGTRDGGEFRIAGFP